MKVRSYVRMVGIPGGGGEAAGARHTPGGEVPGAGVAAANMLDPGRGDKPKRAGVYWSHFHY